jgi:hypothetical protein
MTRAGDSGYVETIPIWKKKYEPGLDCSNMLFIPEHRSGWNYVAEHCKKIHNPNGYTLVDFVEKLWCWNKINPNEKKAVFYDNMGYYIDGHNVKMINGMEYVILDDDLAVYWNGNDWIKSSLDHHIIKDADTYGVFTKPWVGIIHNPTEMPKWFDHENSPQELIKNEQFQLSLTHCKGLIVLSQYLKDELIKIGGWPCPIEVVYHPTASSDFKWSNIQEIKVIDDKNHKKNKKERKRKEKREKSSSSFVESLMSPKSACFGYKKNDVDIEKIKPKKLVQIGYWLRKLISIWEVNVPENWDKYWINRAEYGFTCLEKEIYHEKKVLSLINSKQNVNILKLSDEDYDAFLMDSVIFLDLYDSSCNNAIIEAIVRHIPMIVRKLPATIEYLGEDYCLFFEELSEVYDLLENETLLRKAHLQLKELEMAGKFHGDTFVESVNKIPFLNEPVYFETDTVISIGVDCLPRAFATKFKYKKTKEEGELSCPFDLAWHDYETVCRLIDNDFFDYLNTTRLYINVNGFITHRDYGIVFNHESDDANKLLKFARNDYELFCERYTRRIQNFHNLLNNATSHVVFILNYKEYPSELVNIIKKKYPPLEFTILTLNLPFHHEKYTDQPTNIQTPTENMLFYTVRKPKPEYVWYIDQDPEWEERVGSVFSNHLKCQI